MDIQAEKSSLIHWIKNLKDESLLNQLRFIKLSHQQKDWADELSYEEKKAIERGLSQIEKGEGTASSEVLSQLKSKWL